MPSSTMIRRTRVEVDLAAIVANARTVRAVTGTDVVAVVKADGYGHGAVAVARALTAARAVAGFGVSLVEEGVTLRDAGVMAPVLVMGPSQHGGQDDMVMAGLTPVIGSTDDLAALAAVARAYDGCTPQGRHRDGPAGDRRGRGAGGGRRRWPCGNLDHRIDDALRVRRYRRSGRSALDDTRSA